MHPSPTYKNKREADLLKNALENGRLNHAYLLVGGETGEIKSIVDEIARGIFSKNSEKELSFYEQGSHPDYLEIRPSENSIRVEDVETIASFLSSSPNYAEKRIVVISDCDKMNSYAMNKILKLIEEPPSYALFFLLTELPEALLDTLKSRLTKLEFTIIADENQRDLGEELELSRALLEEVRTKNYAACYETLSSLNEKDRDKLAVISALEFAIMEVSEAATDAKELRRCNLMMDMVSNYRYRLLTNQKYELLITSLISEFLAIYK